MRQTAKHKDKISEKDLQKLIYNYLNLVSGGYARILDVNGIPLKGKRAYKPNPMAGYPDIQFFYKRFCFNFEVKLKGTYQTKKQKEFEAGVKSTGGLYYVVRSLEEVIEVLKSFE